MASTITPVPLAEPGFVGLINVRGEILSVVDLALRLGLTDPRGEVLPETAGKSNHVIVRTTRGLVAVTVDKVNDVVHAGAETYEDVRGGAAEFFTGAYALPSRLVLVLDIDRAVWRQRDLVASA